MPLVPAKCPDCGGLIEVDNEKRAGFCQHCGNPFVVEEAVNNYKITNNINVANATINITGDDIGNLLIRAHQFEANGDYDIAKTYYNRILDIDANHKIANERLLALQKSYIGNIEVNMQQLANIEELLVSGQKIAAIKLVRDITGYDLAEAKYFVDNFYVIDKCKPQMRVTKPVANNTSTSNNSGGCYVATAVYGSYDCPEVWTLRRYRDNSLAKTWYGRAFIIVYYAISPKLVKLFGRSKWVKKIWKKNLDRIVGKLHANGVEKTPYEDRI